MNQTNTIETITNTIKDILSTQYFTLTDTQKLLVAANLILLVSKDNLPEQYKTYGESLLSNGKELSLQLQNNMHNPSLQLAVKAHLIIDLAGKL